MLGIGSRNIPKRKIRLHLVQFATSVGKPLTTLRKLTALLATLRPKPGDTIVFPEMWPSGFSLEDKERLLSENQECRQWMEEYTKRHRCYMMGSMLQFASGKAYNEAYILGPRGKALATYRKIHLFEYGGEHLRFHPGNKIVCSDSPWGPIGLAVCYDLRFPELFRRLARAKARLVIVPSAWPRERLDHFLSLLKARAIENQCFMVGVNKVGPGVHEKPVKYGGHSVIFGPWGEKIVEMDSRSGIRSVELDFKCVESVRKRYPFLNSRVLKEC